jgi:hypothetical protein
MDEDGSIVNATVVSWLPADESDFFDDAGEPAALYKIRYLDGALAGDHEDLEAHEVENFGRWDPVVQKLVDICGAAGVAALQQANVGTPRDLAAWRGAGDVLRDMLLKEGVAEAACPGAAALGSWADAASRALTEDPSLGAHVSGLRG